MDNPVERAKEIKGWMLPAELEWLYETAKQMDSIVEIGSYKGRSTYVLCAGCPGRVYAVDFFMCGQMWPYMDSDPDCYPEFMENVGHFPNLTVIRDTSAGAAISDLIPPMVDMGFIDGDHAPESVLLDLTLWGPRVRKLLSGHDLNHALKTDTPGIEQALTKYCGMKGVVRAVESIWYIKKGVSL